MTGSGNLARQKGLMIIIAMIGKSLQTTANRAAFGMAVQRLF